MYIFDFVCKDTNFFPKIATALAILPKMSERYEKEGVFLK
jgi:hypothetical protein